MLEMRFVACNKLRLRLDPQGYAEDFEPGATVWIKH